MPDVLEAAVPAEMALGSTVEIDLVGELDIATDPAVRDAIRDALRRKPTRIVLDFSQLTFMDSTGIHLAVDTRDRAAAVGSELILIPGAPAVQRVFAIAGAVNRDLIFSWAQPPIQRAADGI